MRKQLAKQSTIDFVPIITYAGKGRPHPELGELIEGFCSVPWSLSRSQIRVSAGETIHEAIARIVRRDFATVAKLSGYELAPEPLRITVEIG